MGDWLSKGGGGAQLPPNLGSDPTQAAALAQQMPQQQGGLTGFLSNPLFQGALGAYLGAVGSPSERGLGGAIMQGGLMGLNAFNQAQQQQLQLPLQQAQLQQARLTTRKLAKELKPLTAEEIQPLTDWKAALDARLKAHQADPRLPDVDPYEMSIVNSLESQARGADLSAADLRAAELSFRDSAVLQQVLRMQQYTGGQQMAYQLGIGPPPPGQQPPAPGQPQSQTGSIDVTAPGPTLPKPGAPPQDIDIPGKGKVTVQVRSDGKVFYNKFENGKWVYPQWAPLQ